MPKQYTESEFAALSDDEIANMGEEPTIIPDEPSETDDPVSEAEEEAVVETVVEDTPAVEDAEEEEEAETEESVEDVEATPPGEKPLNEDGTPKEENPDTDKDPVEPVDPAVKEPSADPTPAAETTPNDGSAANADTGDTNKVDFEAFHKQITAEFKANGRQISFDKPEDIITLMQKGADYTRKLQEMAPHRRIAKTLEKNNINEEQLNFLIDINNKDPKAIAKLVADSGIDPIDLDNSVPSGYQPRDHMVSKDTMNFETALEDVMSTPEGSQFVVEVDRTWDDSSKAELRNDPSIITHLNNHRKEGIYDKVMDQLTKEKALGNFTTTPFVRAYAEVAQAMDAIGAFAPAALTEATPNPAAQPIAQPEQVLATRAAVSKPVVSNGKQAAAVAPVKTEAKPSKTVVKKESDFMSMTDEEFLKNENLLKQF